MKRIILALAIALFAAPALAEYNDSVVKSADRISPQDTISITAEFTGPGEVTVQRDIILPWNYTDDQLADWSAGVIERLNGIKSVSTRIKSGDKLSITRPVRPVIEEPVRP